MMVVMIIALILGIVAALDVYVLIKLVKAFRLLKLPLVNATNMHLPTVTVCIAARNETHAMTQCLERVVSSDYAKLEILVLDDGSRDDTSILIKSFAHSGVRFIEGKELTEGWLGKNYAQSVLARQASGEFVFFMDVDTLIKPNTITDIVKYALSSNAEMVSVIPMRDDNWHASLLFATLRHFWTVVRFRPNRPKAVANAWLINRERLLDQFDTNATLANSLQVETTLAQHLSETGRFRLVVSNEKLGLRYEKRWSSQVETSIRLLYPQCDKSIAKVVWLCLLIALPLFPYALVAHTWWALIPIILQFVAAMMYLSHMWARFSYVGALMVPYTLLQELILLLVSTYKYNCGTITWKGRPISRMRQTD